MKKILITLLLIYSGLSYSQVITVPSGATSGGQIWRHGAITNPLTDSIFVTGNKGTFRLPNFGDVQYKITATLASRNAIPSIWRRIGSRVYVVSEDAEYVLKSGITNSNWVLVTSGGGGFSGDYNDLTNKPTIPTNTNQLTNGAGFIDGTRTITINGNTQTLTTNRTWTLGKSDVGLGNVDNTRDLNKPISTATQTALNAKGSGTVTSLGFTNANGLTGTITNATTTPNLTLNISGLDATKIGNGNISNTEFQYLDNVTSNIQTQLNSKQASLGFTPENIVNKGIANGYTPLGSDGRVPLEYLPSGTQIYVGAWNASTNTPTVINGTGTVGEYYIVSVAGTQNLGAGSVSYALGDNIVYNGTIWERIPNSGGVTSVNSQTGAVSLTTANVPEVTNLYYTESRVNANTNVSANTAARHSAVTIGTASGLSLTGQQLSLAQANSGTTGALSLGDWNIFNNKQPALSGTGIVKSTAGTISYLTDNSANWNTVNSGSTLTNNISGNAVTATDAINTINWGGRQANFTQFATILGEGLPVIDDADGFVRLANPTQIQTWLGLGTRAFDNTNYLPLSGGNITGPVNISGNVGIGTTTPSEKLDVVGNIQANGLIRVTGSSGIFNINRRDTNIESWGIFSNAGNLDFFSYASGGGIKMNLTPSGSLSTTGTITASNFSGSSSGTNTGDQTNITGNAGTVTNGVYTTGSYSNPSWITALAGSKITQDASNRLVTDTEKSTWNGKQNAITLTTTGTSGAATLVGSTLNIPTPTAFTGNTGAAVMFNALYGANGSETVINITHGLSGVSSTTSVVHVTPRSADAAGFRYVSLTSTNVVIHYSVAPPAQTGEFGNLNYSITIKP